MPCAIRYTYSAYLYDAVPCTQSCPRCASCARRTQVPTRTCLPTAACSAACSAQQDPQESSWLLTSGRHHPHSSRVHRPPSHGPPAQAHLGNPSPDDGAPISTLPLITTLPTRLRRVECLLHLLLLPLPFPHPSRSWDPRKTILLVSSPLPPSHASQLPPTPPLPSPQRATRLDSRLPSRTRPLPLLLPLQGLSAYSPLPPPRAPQLLARGGLQSLMPLLPPPPPPLPAL